MAFNPYFSSSFVWKKIKEGIPEPPDLERKASRRLQRKALSTAQRVQQLESRLNRSLLACEALW